jgi:hypothetical protein
VKIVSLIARVLLGLLYGFFGLNGFLHFIPMHPMPPGFAAEFTGALIQSHYMSVVFLFELIPGALLLLNQYVPLALTLLGPVIVNIVLFHAFMAPAGLPGAIVISILWFLAAHRVRSAFAGLFQRRVPA